MNTLRLACFVLAAASSYLSLGYKLVQFRRSRRDPVYLTLMATLLFMCLTFTMGAVALSTDTLFGVRNLAILLMHLSAVIFCVTAEILLLQWSNSPEQSRRKIRVWLSAGLALLVVLVVLFLLADAIHKPASALGGGSGDPLILTYLLVFIASQTLPCVTIFEQCLRYSRITEKPWLRRTLRTFAVGSVLLFCYCVSRTVNILSPLFGVELGEWQALASIFSGLGIFVFSVGVTMPSWGPQLANLASWIRNYSSYKALYPLWHALYETSPGIALENAPSSSVTDLRYRLHRRVIEIRDGWRALRPYMDPATVTPDGDAARAHVEAAKIKQAIQAKQAGQAPEPDHEPADFDEHNADTLAAEVSWLRQVSLAYGRLGS
ncbi:hypothetical protein SAMN05421504_1011470 [Amycolatopsis xylanica]|uniref:DUF6545 domain-containing protein n=1 Tax=Amycolatopsis xylanica TaxID=589385 RepID=A0A1H2WBI8_9PSEU|nr:MAB_1171c family putative transporter [Amycolatopsis xylanica]SDW77399.1 hypothetical protein SAMN05421504_1011470 [Amycolatopsis xylanica]